MVPMLALLCFISGFQAPGQMKKILVINSYHIGYGWTDSLTVGMMREFRKHPEFEFYIENLDSKQFGQTRFGITEGYLKQKFAGFHFDGALVTDNDALDFALKFNQELFPDVPVVFAGISNPEDYKLDGTNFYGFKETSNNDSIVDLIKSLFPATKELYVVIDTTTTGKIYRESLLGQLNRYPGLKIRFPRVMDTDSICSEIQSDEGIDAIFFIEISKDRYGNMVDRTAFLEKIGELARVPIFSNDPRYMDKGVIGGLYQSGVIHGEMAASLLIRSIESKDRKGFSRINISDRKYFFDQAKLNHFRISKSKLPKHAQILYDEGLFVRANFTVLILILLGLSISVVFLSVVNRRRKNRQKRIKSQLEKIEAQNNELEETHKQLEQVIQELGNANENLKAANLNLQEAKKKAEESDNLKSAFLANVSHEIRTPLNSIVGFSSLLVDEDLDEETRKSYIDLIESNTESLLVLIDEIIDLSKIEAQQLSLKKQDFSVDSLITELYQIFTLNQKNHQVQLQINIADQDKELFAFSDRVRVKQIFINLLSNAFKFTDFGIIEFGYFLSDTQGVILFVKDTGIGIKEEHHQSVFQRFRKLNEAQDKRIYRGTGLGLAITQKLVELLGGKIWIESQFGVGSAFYFTLQDLKLKQKEA